ncbi:hypothetical protein [Paenibacillus durus]|uniref:Uncharacterized protein n=1 Tax=Paenibacillus durus ATCC 35681 TaxID=1333534 RepID=A0A0F7FAE5_PAEDU|nr:hypothetical protein [Paenibacillus durus]AKG35637.1 hypothetical protein VK70_14505 [Paenibacillus durus ATCC 35681]
MNSNKSKGISLVGVIVVVVLGVIIGTHGIKSSTSEVTITSQMASKNGTPLFTKEVLSNEMEFNFKETTWFPLINYYMISNEDRTIKIILNKAKKDISVVKAKSISSAVAGLTYKDGRTNYFIYKVVDRHNQLIFTFDLLRQNSEKMAAELKRICKQSDGVIRRLKPRDEYWDGINVTVSDSWYLSQEFQKERFVDTYGTLISQTVLKYMYITGKDDVKVYFVDEFGKEVASPKLFGGYKIKE